MNLETTGIIFDIKKYAIHDGPGIRTTVFFKGCPMQCWWCHNPESREVNPQKTVDSTIGQKITIAEVMDQIKKDMVFYDESGGGVTFSGGEPLMQPEFLLHLLRACKQANIHTTIDTCGYADKNTFEMILPHSDLFLFDLKIMDEQDHQKYIGVPNQKVNENLKFILDSGKEMHIRIPIIPGITDEQKNIDNVIGFLQSLSGIDIINLLPYHKIGAHKYERLGMEFKAQEIEEPSDGKMQLVKEQFEDAGYQVSIGG